MSQRNSGKLSMVAMGSHGCVLPFQAIGFEVVVVNQENIKAVPQTILQLASGECAILFLDESLYEKFKSDVEECNEKSDLSIVPIPDQRGSKGIGLESIRKSVERAVGMDIFNVG